MDTRVHPTAPPVRLAEVWTQTDSVPAPSEGGAQGRTSCADIDIAGLN